MAAPRARGWTLKTGIEVDSDGGELQPKQVEELINYLRGTPTLFGYCDLQEMENESQLIERAGFTGRISHVDVPGVATDRSDYAEFTRDKYTLTAQWFKAITEINYRTSKINVLREGLGEYLRDEMTRQVSLDQQDNVVNGNLLSSDPDLAAFDGLIVKGKANGNVISPGSPTEIDDDVFFALMAAVGEGYDDDPDNMLFLMSRKMEIAYARYMKANWTNTQGNFITQSQGLNIRDKIEFLGTKCRVVAKWPDDTIMYTHRMNVVIGMFVRMFLEMDHIPNPGVDEYIMRYALDCGFKRPEGVAIYDNLTTGLTGTTG